jgi:aminoglycoside 2'-N-acetyltransferase I
MAEAELVIAAAYDLGALSTGIEGFYERSGWLRWLGPTYVLAPGGLTRTEEDDGGVLVLRTPTTPELDLAGPLACDWRSGDVW